MNLRRISIFLLALIVLFVGSGFTFESAQAANCRNWHTVRVGQTLASIGRYYGVNWTYIAQANGVYPPQYKIYAGQVLCIPDGGYYPPYNPPYNPPYYPTTYPSSYTPIYPSGWAWSYIIKDVDKNTSVTIKTLSFPDNVIFKVKIGRKVGGDYEWKNLPNLDTGDGGNFIATFKIPAAFKGSDRLVLRLSQHKKNGKVFYQDEWFKNVDGWSSSKSSVPSPGPGYNPVNYPGYYPGRYPGYYYGVPTIMITGVARNSSVTFRANNFPPHLTFDVYMGPMGTKGVGGYYVGSFNSGGGGSFTKTFSIPPQLYGSYQISIRTQNWNSGYYSYNWFYNNTTY